MSFLSNIDLVNQGNPAVDKGATGIWNSNNEKIINVATPDVGTDAANKDFVVTEIAAAEPSWTEVFVARSLVDQQPAGLDTPLQVNFGAAQGTGGDPAQIDVNGTITINETGYYRIYALLRIGRSLTTGTAFIFSSILKNGTTRDLISSTKLSDNDNCRATPFALTGNYNAADTLEFFIMRDSAGNDDGGLFQITTTATAPNDWGTDPSAYLIIQKFNPT